MIVSPLLGLLIWGLVWVLSLWGSLILVKGRYVSLLSAFLAALLAPIAFALGAAAGFLLVALASIAMPPLLLLSIPAALFLGVLASLGVISALSGVGLLRALAAVLLASLVAALASYLIWHVVIPPQISEVHTLINPAKSPRAF
ncbi:MAG: hypothetical protein JZD41_00425 [Thermoproteus sp.]|nr:hypothetical protein [Thermoproteus sp.]